MRNDQLLEEMRQLKEERAKDSSHFRYVNIFI
jgi:hypothetical protein